MDSRELAKIVGKGIFYASIQASIGSVELSSKFSVINFAKDQKTLDNAAKALRGYIIIGGIWTLGTVLSMYASYGTSGAVIGFLSNAVMMAWIIVSYIQAFKLAAANYGLKEPVVMSRQDWIILLVVLAVIGVAAFATKEQVKGFIEGFKL
jgi:hypothetical protein